MLVKVADYIGTNAITVEHGETIYNLIKDIKNIVLDFEGINNLATPFARFSVGRLLKHRTLIKFNEQVKLVNLSELWQTVFTLVINSSNRYYTNPEYRAALDNAIKERSQEDYDWRSQMSLFAIRHKPSGNLLNYRIDYVHEGYPEWCTLVNYNTWDEDYSSNPLGIWTTQNVKSAKHVIKYPKSGDSKSDPCIDKKINVEDLEVVELIIGNVI